MSGVEVNLSKRLEIDPGGLHEPHGAVDLLGEGLETRVSRIGRETAVPGVDLPQIRVPAHSEGADEVEGGAGAQIGVEHAMRIGNTGVPGESVAIDRIPAIGGQGDAIARLDVRTAGFGVLAGHAPHLDHGGGGAIGEYGGHLQNGLKLEADVVSRVVGEGLGAIASHEHEGPALAGGRHLGAQGIDFAGEDEWRSGAQVRTHCPQDGLIGVGRLLGGRTATPTGSGTGGGQLVHHAGQHRGREPGLGHHVRGATSPEEARRRRTALGPLSGYDSPASGLGRQGFC